jgi:CRISPR/Cas system Type II protein with McrA/HNH and RuvC-like nuclease domain
MNQFTLTCLWCNNTFTSNWDTTRYCSRSHKEQARQLRKRKRNPDYKPRTEHIKQCSGCGIQFTTTKATKKYCNKECREWFKEQAKRNRDAAYINAKTPAFRRRIYFQSEGKCGICKQHIDLSIKYPDSQSYSIDHIVPRSRGGEHNANNLQAAHLGCNLTKSNN